MHSLSLHPASVRWLMLCALLAAGEYFAFKIFFLGPIWPVATAVTFLVATLGYAFEMPLWIEVSTLLLGMSAGMMAASADKAVINNLSMHSAASPPLVRLFVEEDSVEKITKNGKRSLTFNSHLGNVRLKVIGYLEEGEEAPKAGQTWLFSGIIQPVKGDDPSRRRTLVAAGIHSRFERDRSPPAGLACLMAKAKHLRKNLSSRMSTRLHEDRPETALARAMFLGERNAMTKRDKEIFTSAGVFHVFAISGLHVAIVAKIAMFLSSFLFVTRRYIGLVVVPVVWAYVVITGMFPSAVRAAIMASAYFAATMVWRRPNILKAWVFTFLATHIVCPGLVVDVGANYSFAVMLAISLFLDLAARYEISNIGVALGVSVFAWAAGVPISAHIFGRFNLGGLLASPVVIPLATLAVIFESLGILASFISVWIADIANVLSVLIISLMTFIAEAVSKIPFSDIKTRNWTIIECFLWYLWMAGIAAALMYAARKHRDNIRI